MNEDNINPSTGLDSGPPQMPIDEEANRNSLGDFSLQEREQKAYKKRRVMGFIVVLAAILGVVLAVVLSLNYNKSKDSGGSNDSSSSNGEEQDTTMMGAGQDAIVPNDQAEQDVPTLVVDPNTFSINDDEVTYFTHSFSMGSEGIEDDAVYIPVLDNDSPGDQDIGLIVNQIKESDIWGPNHGECIISMDLTSVVYTLNDPKFIGSDECVYEACTAGEEDQVCGTAKVIINVEESEDNVENVDVDPSKVIPLEEISNEAVQLMLDENIFAKDPVVDIWENTIVIGASNDNNDKGTVLVYVKDPISEEWTQQAKLVAPDSETDEEYFGYFVSILVGSAFFVPFAQTLLTLMFALLFIRVGVWIYTRIHSSWEHLGKEMRIMRYLIGVRHMYL